MVTLNTKVQIKVPNSQIFVDQRTTMNVICTIVLLCLNKTKTRGMFSFLTDKCLFINTSIIFLDHGPSVKEHLTFALITLF